MSKYFVISGNHNQYVEWKKRNHPEMLLNGQIQNLSDIVYVSSVHVLKGYSNPNGIFIGTWWDRQDIGEVLLQLSVSVTDTSKVERINQAWEHLKIQKAMT